MHVLPDHRLIELVVAGSTLAWSTMVERYYQELRQYLRWKTGDDDIACELTADVLLSARDRLERLKDDGFRPWIFRYAQLHLLRYRSQQARRAAAAAVSLDDGVADPQSVENEVERSAFQDELIRQIMSLNSTDQRIIGKYYFQGMTCVSIAIDETMSIAAVYKRLKRAEGRLGRKLTAWSSP